MDTNRYQLPVDLQVETVLSQAVNQMTAELEQKREQVLRDVLRHRHPKLASLPAAELGQHLTAYTFGPGYMLLTLTETQEPVVYFEPARSPERPIAGEYGLNFSATIKYAEGAAGAQEFYRIKAQYELVD